MPLARLRHKLIGQFSALDLTFRMFMVITGKNLLATCARRIGLEGNEFYWLLKMCSHQGSSGQTYIGRKQLHERSLQVPSRMEVETSGLVRGCSISKVITTT